jgi:hypothetical protein
MMRGDGYRGDRREGTGVVLAGLDPVSTDTGKPARYPPLARLPVRVAEKQRDAFIAARGRHIRSGSSSCTTVTPAVARGCWIDRSLLFAFLVWMSEVKQDVRHGVL